jgi:hypothetical protein
MLAESVVARGGLDSTKFCQSSLRQIPAELDLDWSNGTLHVHGTFTRRIDDHRPPGEFVRSRGDPDNANRLQNLSPK